ncbi:hypothetical protein RvVAR0630_07270 [Agrobacterium vitis]|nr:hypothetical protein RvVAR0630_07270 [Agrobacterium vitis]
MAHFPLSALRFTQSDVLTNKRRNFENRAIASTTERQPWNKPYSLYIGNAWITAGFDSQAPSGQMVYNGAQRHSLEAPD